MNKAVDCEGTELRPGDLVASAPTDEQIHCARVEAILEEEWLELKHMKTGEKYQMLAHGTLLMKSKTMTYKSRKRRRRKPDHHRRAQERRQNHYPPKPTASEDYNPQAYHSDMREPPEPEYQSDNPQCYHSDER